MSKSGRTMDNHTKGYQKSESKNSTISYRETGCGIQATVTSGGNQFISGSYSSKDEARQEAADMAHDSLGFLYDDED
jgi:dsRNA-specific ribonuclease